MMDLETWPNNLWEDIMEEARHSFRYQEEVEAGPLPILYWPVLDEVLSHALNEREQMVIQMRYVQGMTYKAIGVEIGVKPERIRQMLSHARRKLRMDEYFYRLWAVPVREVIRYQKEVQTLTGQIEQLNQQLSLLSREIESEKVQRRLLMPLNYPVDALDISVRSKNCLVMNGIETVGDLIQCTESKLQSIPHLGKVCMNDIISALAKYSYELEPEE